MLEAHGGSQPLLEMLAQRQNAEVDPIKVQQLVERGFPKERAEYSLCAIV